MEIITGVERRRRWRLDEKLQIVAEVEQPGACFAQIARRYDVSRGLLWSWRRQARNGELGRTRVATFLPVQLVPEQPGPPLSAREAAPAADARIEITLPDGTTLRVGRDVGAVALRRVLGVLRG